MKMNAFSTKTVLLLIFIVFISASDDYCPRKCTCKKVFQRDKSTFIKLRCGDRENKLISLDELDLMNLASEIVHLNLSNNLLTTFYPKVQFIALQKLDLSKNQLIELLNNQFAELPNLRRLDLSRNSIKVIETEAFSKLNNLERLKLNQNQIGTIGVGTFDSLINLKQLDISNNPLTCDCSLLWLLDWSQRNLVKLVSSPTCNSPPLFKGVLLRKLKVGVDIHCKSPALSSGVPIIEMKPKINQVVFEGDSLKLHCRALSISEAYDSAVNLKIKWTWLDFDPEQYFNDVNIETHFIQNTGFVVSTLSISSLKRNHTGMWTCVFTSVQGNYSEGITLVVISDDTQYCPTIVTSSNKGTYVWPRTVVNYTATIPCESVNLNYDVSIQTASYSCSGNGQWKNLNTSMCAYTSETTKILEQFSKVNSSIMESAKHFRNYTSNQEHFKDVMDVAFAVDTMTNYLKYLTVDQIGGVLMDVTDNLLHLPKEYLMEAQYSHQTCTKLVNITEGLAGISSSSQLHKTNIATEVFPVKKNGFSGLKCTWYADLGKSTNRLFSCVTSSQSDSTEMHGKTAEASVIIPETLFQQLEEDHGLVLTDNIYNILIAMHANNKLFPVDERNRFRYDIKTAVVGAKLVDITVTNLTDPVFIMLRAPSATVELVPVWWDVKAGGFDIPGVPSSIADLLSEIFQIRFHGKVNCIIRI